MRISRPDSENRHQRYAELIDATQVRLIRGRVVYGSNCAEAGPDASALLTADPIGEPVEPGALPLVFALKRLELFQPCWSCEGHLGVDGELWKLPRIWFYAGSLVGVKLLGEGLTKLQKAGQLRASWRVVLTFSDPDNVETTFSLEPVTPLATHIDLPELQRDMDTIASALPELIGEQAKNLMRDSMPCFVSATGAD